MRKKITLLKLAVCMLVSYSGFSQNRTTFSKRTPSGHIRCATTEYETLLREQYPNRATSEEFENWLAPKIEEAKRNRENSTSKVVISVPVVIHIISNGDAIGTNENISNAQALSQITVLNQDFRKMFGTPGYNTNPVGADIEIEFCLAQRKPDGTATTGIDRVTRTSAAYNTYSATETMKAATIWDSTQYFNIWTVFFTNNSSQEMYGTLGYAQFPSTSGLTGLNSDEGPGTTDGLVVDYRAFGSSAIAAGPYYTGYDLGRTATHEIGHCFGLLHIWGDAACGTDYCADTPVAHDANFGCPTVTNCSSTGNEMVQNYMDYTDDSCMNIFTINQKDRITAVMNNSLRRASLKTSNACTAPLSAQEFDLLNSVQLYPNPTNEIINIALSNSELPDNFVIFNSLGQTIKDVKVASELDLAVNMSQYQAGVYFIRIAKDGSVRTLRFIKE
ncbi:MAG TPA: T9SS type A sorting domain-containing protein [Flavobacterium sp.]|uniref:T9SS type A sorting domain-containing protein n=1 Tax=Flavobacterium sp. TaxID=239 RepID=UPI002BB46F96|nr:T9SS type A sorting domain-containing protein [Flavobacterium sp.]HSD14238.1 T9SS type A sorting domain-containing protein [Flavobacterium sp.]